MGTLCAHVCLRLVLVHIRDDIFLELFTYQDGKYLFSLIIHMPKYNALIPSDSQCINSFFVCILWCPTRIDYINTMAFTL